MSAATTAAALGGGASGGGYCRARCPVHGGTQESLSLRDTPDGLFVKCFAGCGREDIVAELQRRGLLGESDVSGGKAPVAAPFEDEAARAKAIASAMEIWRSADPADEIYVKPYLWSRLLVRNNYGSHIRFHPAVWHADLRRECPAMVALCMHNEHGPVGVHITYLQADSHGRVRKISADRQRIFRGRIKGAGIPLGKLGADGAMVLGEGIESTLSAMLGLGLPGWAALFAGNLPDFVLPPMAKRVFIAADNDKTGTGQDKARAAERRFRAAGLRVVVGIPPEPGTDFNDMLMKHGVLEIGGGHVW